jgi:hypothetical protein
VRDGDDDDRAGLPAGGNHLADGEELMPGADDSAGDDSAGDDTAADDSAGDAAAGDYAAGDYAAGGESAAHDGGHTAAGDGADDDADGDADGDAEPLHGGAGDAGPLADDGPLVSGVEELRAGWQRARIAFVDNPRGAVAEAAGLTDEAAEALAAALRERRHRIRATWDGDGPARDTEALRVALLRYQALFAKIVGD